ncbi:stress responsive A/B barrel domain-containing protein [Calycina marina]|uniref:Stress responsive A/B barrel domain-containing protein n=1 Tax=Calycina marina TaxID=1763456 RepID=A0A9P7ZBS9_9HELO|nr:stress responsive A/B barrel domain-containing protein [Calycina marina]
MSTQITRVTMIKVAPEHLDIALEGFKTFAQNQQKNGKPYILSMEAGPINGGQVKDRGFTFLMKSVFKSQEDMEFYMTKCEGHEAYKVYLKENAPVTALQAVTFTPGASFEI